MLTSQPKPIGLKEFIERVKAELLEEHDESKPLFAIGQIELEISLTVERTMDGGVNLHVVQSGVEKTMADVQMVKVMLEPLVPVEEPRKKLSEQQQQQASQSLTRGT